MIRTVIVDDELLARSRIKELLSTFTEFELIGECKNGAIAAEFINSKKPDLIFLDIQMPGFNGFEVIEQLSLQYTPFIIFVTAFEQYALKAFDVNAVDYLLKPFDDDRFAAAIDRAKAQIKLRKSDSLNQKMMNLLNDFTSEDERKLKHIKIKENGLEKQINLEDVLWIETEGNYITVHLTNDYYLYRSTMNAFEEEIDSGIFLRIHRSFMINMIFLKSFRYLGKNNEYEFTMKDGKKLISGRSYKDKIMSFLSESKLI